MYPNQNPEKEFRNLDFSFFKKFKLGEGKIVYA